MPISNIVKPLITEPLETGKKAAAQTLKKVGKLPTEMAKTAFESLTVPPKDNEKQREEEAKTTADADDAGRAERLRKFRAKQRQMSLLRRGILAEQKRKEQKRMAEEQQKRRGALIVEQKKKEPPLSVQMAQKGREIFRGASG